MASLRTGVDIIEIERFSLAYQRYRGRLLQRIFTPMELAENGENMSSLAARFAAKEAVAKAFGTGIGQISWHDIEICRGPLGEPVLKFHGAAQQLAEKDQLGTWSISLSHSQKYAIAFAVAMGN